MDIRKKVDEKIREIRIAAEDWILLQEKLRVEANKNDRVILFPNESQSVYEFGIRYLDTFIMRQNIDNAYVVYVDDYVGDNVNKYCQNRIISQKISEAQMKRLITLYSLYPMENRITVVSLDKPYMRWGTRLKGIKDVTEEQLIAIGVYGIIPFRKNG